MRNILLTFVFFLLLFGACKYTGRKKVTGNHKIAVQQRNIEDFEGVDVAGPMKVYITQGSNYSVKIEAEENLMDYIETDLEGNTLEINFKRNYRIRSHKDIKVYITAPQFKDLQVAGSGGIWSQSRITHPDEINIDIAGSGDVVADLDAPRINTEIGGSGSTILKGATRDFKVEIAGSGEVRAFDLLSETVRLEIAGSGDAQVFASKQLDVEIAGSGDVIYKGAPAVKQSKAGSGSVRKAD
jgi:hypothetical protein